MSGGEGGVGFRVAGTYFVGVVCVAEGKNVVFEGAGAVETPGVFGYGMGELVFESVVGVEAGGDFDTERIEGGAIFFRHEGDLAG